MKGYTASPTVQGVAILILYWALAVLTVQGVADGKGYTASPTVQGVAILILYWDEAMLTVKSKQKEMRCFTNSSSSNANCYDS
jgi:hypothetical protein